MPEHWPRAEAKSISLLPVNANTRVNLMNSTGLLKPVVPVLTLNYSPEESVQVGRCGGTKLTMGTIQPGKLTRIIRAPNPRVKNFALNNQQLFFGLWFIFHFNLGLGIKGYD